MAALRLVLTVLALLACSVNAATYYVSSSTGNDRNVGNTISKPWKSFTPLYQRAYIFQPGDSILFCQGDQWFYSPLFAFATGTTAAPITWGSYQCRTGVTDKPVISPAVSVSANAWSISSANSNVLVYNLAGDSIAASAGIQAIWAGEQRHMPARSPNLGDPKVLHGAAASEFYFSSTMSIESGLILVPALTQANNYWVGANIYMRTNNWTYQQTIIIASGPGWLQVRDWPDTGSCSGFYLENAPTGPFSTAALLQVDAPGEWMYNRNDNKLYLWPATSALRQQLLAGTATAYFIYGNTAAAATVTGNNHVIQDINFKYGAGGIVNSGARTFTVLRNSIKGVSGFGIITSNAPGAVISQNVVDDVDGDCIMIDSVAGTVTYNNVSRCGVIAGYGASAGALNNGITAHSSTVSFNTITGTGYNGIEPHYGSTVSFNMINDVLKSKNDGGGIYMFGSSGNGLVLESNIINGVTGNWNSWTEWNIASCVFTDEGTSQISIYNNTCSNAPQCMQLNDAASNMILSNRCNAPGIYLNDGYSGGGHMVIGNLITTAGTNGILQNPIARIYAPGQSNLNQVFSAYYQNIYCQSQNSGTYLYQKDFGANGVWRYYSFSDWQQSECAGRSDCMFDANSAMYNGNCQSYRPFYFYNTDVGSLISDLKNRENVQTAGTDSGNKAAEIAAPVVASIVAVTLVIALAILGSRYYAKLKASRSAESELPLSMLSSRPQSPDVSFSSLPSPSSHSTMSVELHPIPSQ